MEENAARELKEQEEKEKKMKEEKDEWYKEKPGRRKDKPCREKPGKNLSTLLVPEVESDEQEGVPNSDDIQVSHSFETPYHIYHILIMSILA